MARQAVTKRRRRAADNQAAEFLRVGQPISDTQVLAVLSLWRFRPNKARLNVIPDGQDFVSSDTIGLVCDRSGRVVVDSATRKYPNLFRLLAAWLKQRRPTFLAMDFPFTNIPVNHSYAAKLHRDAHNAGVSLTKSFGDTFVGGQLTYWPNDDGRILLADLQDKDSVTVDTRSHYTLFDGRRAHRVERFSGGDRYSTVFFSVTPWANGPRDDLPAGVVYPSDYSLQYSIS